MVSVKLLFTCPVTGEDVSAYVYEPLELMMGATITLTCDRCSAPHSWATEDGRIIMENVTGAEPQRWFVPIARTFCPPSYVALPTRHDR
jgi:hypothetical protein